MFNYHQNTKHSYKSIRSNRNYMDWSYQPSTYKIYNNFINNIKLDGKNSIHNLIYRLGSISAKKVYTNSEYYLRTLPSAGALFPVEIYFQARGIDDLEDGIYHFDIFNSSIKLLYELDNDGIECHFKDNREIEGLIFLYSSIYFRSSWKYKHRAFRYCLLDSGHALGALEASCYLYDHAYLINYQFEKIKLNEAFGFGYQEFFLSSARVGIPTKKRVSSFDMKLENINPNSQRDEQIEKAYHDSCTITKAKNNYKFDKFSFNKEMFEEAIFKRRSIRNFTTSTISKASYEAILEIANKSIMSDCDEEVSLYAIINDVEGVDRGVYLDQKVIKRGDFREKAGYLTLEQDLGKESAITFFLTTSSPNYQSSYQKAGIIGHRIYLASEYLQIGCSGIGAYYDDEVKEFLGADEMILYGVVIGV